MDSNNKKKEISVNIDIKKLNITDENLELIYRIKNETKQEIWICDFIDSYEGFEIYMADDNETLLIRRRLDVPSYSSGYEHPIGRYVRLLAGLSREESLVMPLPILPKRTFNNRQERQTHDTEYAKHIAIEIGFYSGNLPEMIFKMLEGSEKDPYKKHVDDIGVPIDVVGWFVSSVHFNRRNEGVWNRCEQVMIPYTYQTFKGEHVVMSKIDNLNVPYKEEILPPKYFNPDIKSCTRIEIVYHPSMLEYFFPYQNQQNLLSIEEKHYLDSHNKDVIDDKELIRNLDDEISKGYYGGDIVCENRKAQVTCFHEDELLTSFTIYDDRSIETKDGHRVWYRGSSHITKTLAQQIKQFEFRYQCAVNMRNLWYRFHLYHKAKQMSFNPSENIIEIKEPIPIVYPTPNEWCDRLLQAYLVVGRNESIIKAYKCPATDEGKSTYAMNPNCEPNSPGDMVLLFETKAGWNQHGGPELFTFNNHDPKGGCVLLNDGTVKFIRTKEELNALKWK